MTPERWQRVMELLDEAVNLAPAERSNYLNKIGASDEHLQHELESLLLSHEQAGHGFLETPAVALQQTNHDEGPFRRVGCRIGAYKILEQIGQGGMGEVYRAVRDDGQFTKEVGLKLVRCGMDTSFVLHRFRNERQILAGLDHPNIARLFDGGTTDDHIPYLVMEFVQGVPIDTYCDEHCLNITQRLQLFRQVCSAIQYAHQRLVVHRDIKPSNILVDNDGIPKLLDFGIAKIVDNTSGPQEMTLLRSLTPEYASPEQIQGQAITTSTDVYSLGVVLYRLLTGRSPYPGRNQTSHDLARAIVEKEPVYPSAVVSVGQEFSNGDSTTRLSVAEISSYREGSPARLHRRLSGDLDNIVLKALRKLPERRYGSVEQFDEDIRCHLAGLPVSARKDSWRYRAAKFVRRNKVVVAAVAAVVLVLLGGVIATLREARVARRERAQAERRFNDVRKLANSLIFEVDDSIRDLPGSTQPRRLIVTRALEYLDNLSRESKDDASLQLELASAYERVGDVLGFPYGANLGDHDGALQSYRKALAIRETWAANRPGDVQLHETLVQNYFTIARVLEASGDFHGALNATQQGVSIAQSFRSDNMSSAQADRFAGGYYIIAGLLIQTGDPAAALQNYRKAAAIRQGALDKDSANMLLRAHLAADYAGQAKALAQQGDLNNAAQIQVKAIAILQEVSRAFPQNATLREYAGEAISRLGGFQIEQGNATAALKTYRDSHKIFEDLIAADSKNHLAKSNFAFTDSGIGSSLVRLGKPEQAIKWFREAIVAFEELSPGTSSDRYPRSGLTDAYSGLGQAYTVLAESRTASRIQQVELWKQARSSCEKSLALWKDKQKRGELESGEIGEEQRAADCISQANSHIDTPTARGSGTL